MIVPKQLRHLIKVEVARLNPTLATPHAVELLMLTAAAETHCGRWLWQDTGAEGISEHALGLFQMERLSFQDALLGIKKYKSSYIAPERERLVTDHRLAIWAARCYYLRFVEPIPHYADIEGLARYWKRYWNTPAGAGTVHGAVEKYNRYATKDLP